ncbi:GDP-mannose-dependent alpha-(1-6)-phosphatidylinositol monomannoside mannosyltransferase [Planctomycetes bacterium K23_9]|uniref:GDP-mannose-dependent alpha-(1-6)-phosphatidylinositol monomannoside mannosyltransferase n=2 Tax=Stieleria marina TaxID=1930275 RepID=A0A517NMK9_9BACT|nr:GDP-mannose-dependent alpha-(1-6)-phosphatidylinositol monomannoside mannosyltransferase [Planctomycetes bacterium K23_9]
MRQMLGEQIVVNIDDMRNTTQGTPMQSDTLYIPRRQSGFRRVASALRLTSETKESMRDEWLLKTITQHDASLAFVHFLDFAVRFHEVWSRLDIPIVVHCHGYDITWDVRHHTDGTLLHPLNYRDSVRDLPDNVWFIANSTYTQSQLEQLGINPEKIFLKRFGVPVSHRPNAIPADASPRILFLGRLVDFKGPLETVQAFSQIAQRHDQARLDIAGGGDLASAIQQRIRDLGTESSIHCHGAVSSDRGQELRDQSVIFTAHNQTGEMTGQQEAFGVSLLEAMGQGIPVVTGRSGGIVDFVHHEENGMLFTPGDIDAHAGMLNELLSSPKRREELGEAAWHSVRQNYQPHHEQSDLNRIFRQVSDAGSMPTVQPKTKRHAA